MRWLGFFVLPIALATGAVVRAQSPTYHLGRTPTPEEIRAADVTVGPAGRELPPGSGTAKKGAEIFAKKCAHCHGPTGVEGQFPKLVGGELHPFATTIWSFINSSMPRNVPDVGLRQETLSADEVYALTAFILYRNGIVKEDDVLDAKSLPKIRMPTRDRRLDGLAPRP
jgi:cytochrome c